jgi:protein arginine kinase activator
MHQLWIYLGVGCAQCYSVFGEELREYLAELHGNFRHVAVDEPVMKDEIENKSGQLAPLREKLSEAVRQEKFEEAFKIKNEINQIEKQNGSH